MSFIDRTRFAFKAIKELGLQKIILYALYQLKLKSGYLRYFTPPLKTYKVQSIEPLFFKTSQDDVCIPLTFPTQSQLRSLLNNECEMLISEADDIIQGKIRLFGSDPLPLQLCPSYPLRHWTSYTDSLNSIEDIKLIWEPARFCWSYTLCRAYLLTGNEIYSESFWLNTELFLNCNLINMGPNWASGQEVAMRIMALSFSLQVFAHSPHTTPQRIKRLYAAIADHAERIPHTLLYARAQNNNHLLTKAVALYTASVFLPDHPKSAGWRKTGWRWLNHALQTQIDHHGTYIQHSTNYHRLMLQAAMWAQAIAKSQNMSLPLATLERLTAATNWLLAQLDPISGKVPNLGHNDGSYILPLAPGGFSDYRPVAQAASRFFLSQPSLPPGPWDELCLWLGLSLDDASTPRPTISFNSPGVLRLGNSKSWATLRAVKFSDRPAHADQLHVDIWWQGHNIAIDAGTYRYTAPAPWMNALSHTAVHNTIMVDGQDQMQRAGRFLWLDWAQAHQLPSKKNDHCLVAEHNGYSHLGVIHRRSLIRIDQDNWQVIDSLLPSRSFSTSHTFYLHWLLPDLPWKLSKNTLHLNSPFMNIKICVKTHSQSDIHAPQEQSYQLIRAGQILHGQKDILPTHGWYSPTYNLKLPALSFRTIFTGIPPITIVSDWKFTLPFLLG